MPLKPSNKLTHLSSNLLGLPIEEYVSANTSTGSPKYYAMKGGGTGNTSSTSGAILLAPAFIAKVAVSPTMTKRVIDVLSRKRPLPARAAEQIVTRMVYELGIDPQDFEGSGVNVSTLRSRLDDLEERKKQQSKKAFTDETLAEGA